MSYYWFNKKELISKSIGRYHNGGGKEKAAEYYLKNRRVLKKMQIIRIKPCKRKKKKQIENTKEVDTET